jgi:hypothetical protein
MARRKNAVIPAIPANPELGFVEVADARKRAYLIDYALCGGVMHACRTAGVSRQSAFIWRNEDEQFQVAEENAFRMYTERLEREALRRAVEGIEHGVWYKGDLVGQERTFSDSLLAALLKANLPEKYGDALRVGGGEPIRVMNLGLNLDSEQTHAIIDKLLLTAYKQTTTKISDVDVSGIPGGNGKGSVG